MSNDKKWDREEVLAEARRRVASMVNSQTTPDGIQKMLESLVLEAGWDDKEFVNALCKDVIRRSTRPAPRVSGTMTAVSIPRDGVQKKAGGSRSQ